MKCWHCNGVGSVPGESYSGSGGFQISKLEFKPCPACEERYLLELNHKIDKDRNRGLIWAKIIGFSWVFFVLGLYLGKHYVK